MNWRMSFRADAEAREIADRHYNRQHVGAINFCPPARTFVLKCDGALWVSSWPYAEYTKHEWGGAWVNSTFRREAGDVASVLIREAVAATRWYWGDPPPLGMVTFIDRSKVRRKRDYGRCYLKAGFRKCGETKSGLLALQLLPCDMPEETEPHGIQSRLFDYLAPCRTHHGISAKT